VGVPLLRWCHRIPSTSCGGCCKNSNRNAYHNNKSSPSACKWTGRRLPRIYCSAESPWSLSTEWPRSPQPKGSAWPKRGRWRTPRAAATSICTQGTSFLYMSPFLHSGSFSFPPHSTSSTTSRKEVEGTAYDRHYTAVFKRWVLA